MLDRLKKSDDSDEKASILKDYSRFLRNSEYDQNDLLDNDPRVVALNRAKTN